MTLLKRTAAVVAVLILVLAGAVSPFAWHYFINHNWRTVEEGAVYGSRQMAGPALERTFDKYGIRTVVNLRSANPGRDWYDEQLATCEANGVRMVDISWSSGRLPSPDSVIALLDLYDEGEGPFLLHCAGGTHRTGVAAAIYLLHHGATPERARQEFKIGFNDAEIGEIVTLYERSRMPFREWAETMYPAIHDAWNDEHARESEVDVDRVHAATGKFAPA